MKLLYFNMNLKNLLQNSNIFLCDYKASFAELNTTTSRSLSKSHFEKKSFF